MSRKKDHRHPEPNPPGADRLAEDHPSGAQPSPAQPSENQPGADNDSNAAPEIEVPRVEDILADEQFTELTALRVELDDAKDRALRCMAEMENYKKRIARQVEDERRYANLPLIRDLLPALDNLARAIEASERTHEAAGLLEGVKMVAQQIEDALGRHDCRRIDALNQPFDPNLHAAISQQPAADVPPGTVVLVAQAGFRLHDRVVRPSQVIVSSEVAGE